MGGTSDAHPGDDRRVAQGAVPVALPGAHLQFGGHHAADAGGRPSLPHRRPQLEGHHAEHAQGRTCRFYVSFAQHHVIGNVVCDSNSDTLFM